MAVSIFLIVLSAATSNHLSTIWRVTFGIGCLLPLAVFYFRIKMLNSNLYRRGAIKRRVPYLLVIKYWKSLIGTCGAWLLYDFVRWPRTDYTPPSSQVRGIYHKVTFQVILTQEQVTFPNGVFSGAIIQRSKEQKYLEDRRVAASSWCSRFTWNTRRRLVMRSNWSKGDYDARILWIP